MNPITLPNHRPLALPVKMRIGTDLVTVGVRDLWQKWFWVSDGFCLFICFLVYLYILYMILPSPIWVGEMQWMNKFLTWALEELHMTTLRHVFYIFPTTFVIFSAKSRENSCSRNYMEASILKLLLLDQKDISGSLWFVGLIYWIELCGLFYTLLVEIVFFPRHITLKNWMISSLLRYMWQVNKLKFAIGPKYKSHLVKVVSGVS